MADNDNNERKQPSRETNAEDDGHEAANDNEPVSNRDEGSKSGPRGEAIVGSGLKVHGDKLEGMIPGKSRSQDDNRPERDDGDNDDEGELK